MSHEANAGDPPAHAGKGHLVGNILVFAILFGMFLLGMYLLTWFTPQNIWPMAAIIVLAFVAFFVPQAILGRADTGYNLAEGNRSEDRDTSAGVGA